MQALLMYLFFQINTGFIYYVIILLAQNLNMHDLLILLTFYIIGIKVGNKYMRHIFAFRQSFHAIEELKKLHANSYI